MFTTESLRQKVVPIQRCGFCGCGSDHKDVDLLVASKLPGVYICQGCIAMAVGTLLDNRPKYKEPLRRLVAAKRGSPSKTAPR